MQILSWVQCLLVRACADVRWQDPEGLKKAEKHRLISRITVVTGFLEFF